MVDTEKLALLGAAAGGAYLLSREDSGGPASDVPLPDINIPRAGGAPDLSGAVPEIDLSGVGSGGITDIPQTPIPDIGGIADSISAGNVGIAETVGDIADDAEESASDAVPDASDAIPDPDDYVPGTGFGDGFDYDPPSPDEAGNAVNEFFWNTVGGPEASDAAGAFGDWIGDRAGDIGGPLVDLGGDIAEAGDNAVDTGGNAAQNNPVSDIPDDLQNTVPGQFLRHSTGATTTALSGGLIDAEPQDPLGPTAKDPVGTVQDAADTAGKVADEVTPDLGGSSGGGSGGTNPGELGILSNSGESPSSSPSPSSGGGGPSDPINRAREKIEEQQKKAKEKVEQATSPTAGGTSGPSSDPVQAASDAAQKAAEVVQEKAAEQREEAATTVQQTGGDLEEQISIF